MKKIIEIKNQILSKLNIKNIAIVLGSLVLLSIFIVLFGLPLIGIWTCTAIITAILYFILSKSKCEDLRTSIGVSMVIIFIAGFITGIVWQCNSYDDMYNHYQRKWHSDIVYNTGNYIDVRGGVTQIVTYRISCDSVINQLQTSYNIANITDYEDIYNKRIILTGIVWNRNLTKVGSKVEPPKITTYNKLDGCLDTPKYIDTAIINNYKYTTLIATHMDRSFYLDTTAIIDYKLMKLIAQVNGEDTGSGGFRIEKLDTEKLDNDTITIAYNNKNKLCNSSKNCIISNTAKTTTKPYSDKNKYLKRTITTYLYITNSKSYKRYNGIKFGDLDTLTYSDTTYTNKSIEISDYELKYIFDGNKVQYTHKVKEYYYQVSFGYDDLDKTEFTNRYDATEYMHQQCKNKSSVLGKTIYSEYDACLKYAKVNRSYHKVSKLCGTAKPVISWKRGSLASHPYTCNSSASWSWNY